MAFKFLREKILFLIFLISLVFLVFYFKNQIKNFVYLAASPIESLTLNLSKKFFSFYTSFLKCTSPKKENEILKSEIERLVAENERLKELKKENENLRKALGLELEKKFELKMARFTGKDVSGDLLRIDKGVRDGITEGLTVITPENILIGKIFKVYQNFSVVQVFTDKDFSFDVKISEKDIPALAKGQGNFKAKIEFLPKEKEIKEGDKVLTSALGGKFPAGIFVGEIEKVEKSDIEFYQKAQLKPAFRLENLDYLFVILNF